MDDAAIKALTVEERYELIDRLWASLDIEDIGLTPEHKAELDRRIATFDEDIKSARPWDEVKTDLERRYR